MHLIEVDGVHFQAPEAVLKFAANRVGFDDSVNVSLFIGNAAAFGEYVRTIRAPLERLSDYFLRVPESINSSGIDPIHAVIDRITNRLYGFVIVLRSPSEFPPSA